jgi:hypothetical protein
MTVSWDHLRRLSCWLTTRHAPDPYWCMCRHFLQVGKHRYRTVTPGSVMGIANPN